MRKATDLQEEVMRRGLEQNALPKTFQPQIETNSENGETNSQLQGYG